MKKLYNDRGETLIEVLAAILIASLSVALMFGCVMASTTMDDNAKALDQQHYADLTAADAQSAAPDPGAAPAPVPGTVTIQREDVKATPGITIYGEGGMYSYRRSG